MKKRMSLQEGERWRVREDEKEKRKRCEGEGVSRERENFGTEKNISFFSFEF